MGTYVHNMAKQEMAASNKARRHSQPVRAATQHATKLKVGQTRSDLQKLKKKMGKAGEAFGCATDDTPVQWFLMKCWVLCKPDGNPVLLISFTKVKLLPTVWLSFWYLKIPSSIQRFVKGWKTKIRANFYAEVERCSCKKGSGLKKP